MSGALTGGIAALFGAVFGGVYVPGTLTRKTLVNDGQGGATAQAAAQPCMVQVDGVTEAMRSAAGYTEKDVRVLVLQSGVSGGDIDSDCTVTVLQGAHAGNTYALNNIGQDPASSYWECRGTPA